MSILFPPNNQLEGMMMGPLGEFVIVYVAIVMADCTILLCTACWERYRKKIE